MMLIFSFNNERKREVTIYNIIVKEKSHEFNVAKIIKIKTCTSLLLS